MKNKPNAMGNDSINQYLIDWLLNGDVAIQYQAFRDLLDIEKPELQERIANEGWGARFLAKRNKDGHWGQGFYQPKWTSSHYTLLDLRNLNISPETEECRKVVKKILQEEIEEDGGVNPGKTVRQSDVCLNGMFLNYASYFGAEEKALNSIVDFILSEKMPDGGFNCQSNRSGATHSSLHSTISVMEGIATYEKSGYNYRLDDLKEAEKSSTDFILLHQLFKSDKSGKVIRNEFLRIPYPCRWKYDVLRALDYFQQVEKPWDERMLPAMEVLLKKRMKDGTWPVQAKHPGKIHFEMEKAGKASRWNTLRMLRVLRFYDKYL